MVTAARHWSTAAKLAFSLLLATLGLGVTAASASAAADSPQWTITSYTTPTNLPPGGTGEVMVTAVNTGSAATDGSTITIEDSLPGGLAVKKVSGFDAYASGPFFFPKGPVARPKITMSCSSSPVLCKYNGVAQPGDQLVVAIEVEVEAGAPSSVINRAVVSGGGATHSASVEADQRVSSEPARFGLAPGSVFAAFSSHQAGAHANVSTGFALNTTGSAVTAGDPKDVVFDLPPGAVGNTVGMPRCTSTGVVQLNCPANSIVGVATVDFLALGEEKTIIAPVFNIAPAPGEPAAFMFTVLEYPVRLDTSVLSDGNYGVRVTAADISQTEPVISSYVTIWGVPAEHQAPGPIPILEDEFAGVESLGSSTGPTGAVPLLSSPTQCSDALTGIASADFWRAPGAYERVETPMGSMTGCLEVPFSSSFTLLPDTLEAGAPAGYDFHLHVAQQSIANQPSASDVKSVSLTLPEGVVVNPSAAWGLKACSAAQFYDADHPSQRAASPAKCPREAQVGTIRVKTPALEEALEGVVYLAEPECDPCSPQDAQDGKMIKLFVQLISEGEGGIVVKLEGHGTIDQQTGQITTVFDENPQLPFSELKLALTGGPRSALANPRKCGTVKATGVLEPWSILEAPEEAALVSTKVSDSLPFYEFEINQNCFGPQFNPSFVAGSPNIQSGAYTPFTLAFGRSDNDEFLNGITQTMPPGLLGNLSSIPLCKEPEAAQGTCGAGSLIGHVQVLTGPGANPFLVSGGQVFLTEGYKGAPYGLSIVVPAVAGPYTLSGTTGKGTVVVRAKIVVDPIDAHLTVTSDPLPTVLDGIPLQLKAVNVTIDRSDFTFNPTSCAKMSIGGLLSSSEGMTANRSSSFQVTNCSGLGFKPAFKVTTNGKTSRAGGASLKVKLSYPKAAFGSQTNIAKVKVDLPKQLPSRLSTLQKACPAKTFEANPATCTAGSKVGFATATTPIIPVSLSGPAYFVSYGGAKFPELVIVLSGYGVTVDLHGETFINEKTNVTSSTFRQVPDVPIGGFELTLPQGSSSALAATANLCRVTLTMPTAFTAQNGMVIKQSTPIAPTGCPKHKTHKKTKLKKKK